MNWLKETYYWFRDKYDNKYIDYDGMYGAQCWDLGQLYFVEALGLPDYILGGCDLVSNMLVEPKLSLMKEYFDIIPLDQKEPGDVEIFSWGHIAIFDNWDGEKNWYFTQNQGTAENPIGPAHIEVISDNPSCMAFRLKQKYWKEQPKPKIELPKPVDRNEEVDQIEVLYADTNRVRSTHEINDDNIIGLAYKGFYNILSRYNSNEYSWFEVEPNKWLAETNDTIIYHPKKDQKEPSSEEKLKEYINTLENEKNALQHELDMKNQEIDELNKEIAELQEQIGTKIDLKVFIPPKTTEYYIKLEKDKQFLYHKD